MNFLEEIRKLKEEEDAGKKREETCKEEEVGMKRSSTIEGNGEKKEKIDETNEVTGETQTRE